MKNYEYSDRLSCYDGLRLAELDGSIDDLWLVVCIEAAWYCKLNDVDFIRFTPLKTRCNEILNLLTHGKRNDFGGTFERILDSPRWRNFLAVQRYKRKGGSTRETYIYPNIEAVQNEVTKKRLDNLEHGRKVLTGRVPGIETLHIPRKVFEPPVSISERGPYVKVTRANPQQE